MALGKGLQSLIPQKSDRKRIRLETSTHDLSRDRVWDIPISEIVPNSEQPRKYFSHEDMESLVSSIKKHGVLQPLMVTEKEDGGYELIAGERRLRASQMAGLATVPAMVRSATQQDKLELALIENIQRQDLNPIEEAFSYKRLSEEFGLTAEKIAERVGKSRPHVSNIVRLLDLPEEIKRAVADGQLEHTKARTILGLSGIKAQMNLFHKMIGANSVTVREAERVVQLQGSPSRKGSIRRDPNLASQELLLEERLGTKINITQKGERGTIIVHYHSKEELKRLIEELS